MSDGMGESNPAIELSTPAETPNQHPLILLSQRRKSKSEVILVR
jgi:hypothetical protein